MTNAEHPDIILVFMISHYIPKTDGNAAMQCNAIISEQYQRKAKVSLSTREETIHSGPGSLFPK